MGLDQYLVATTEPLSAENPGELPWEEREVWEWRKHYPLAEFVAHKANLALEPDDDPADSTYAVTADY